MGTSPHPNEGQQSDLQHRLRKDPITNATIAQAAASGWLGAFFSSPSGHRVNAQAGYTIAAAVATAIVGAGILTSVDEAPIWVQLPLLAALLLWLVTAWKFMRTIAYQPNLSGVAHAGTAEEMGTIAIQRTWIERDIVAKRSWHAQRMARIAGIWTFLTVVLVLARPTLAMQDVTVALTADGSEHLQQLCTSDPTPRPLVARVDPQKLGDDPLVLHDVPCPNAENKRTVRLPQSDIAGTAIN